jgi:S1-C subfamily serine protease
MRHVVVATTAILIPLAQALAAPSIDRSQLSLDENLVINNICGPARSRSADAYDECVRRQLAALKAHPTPDRSAMSAAQIRTVEYKCDYMRRIGIAEYNDCLGKAIAAGDKPAPEQSDDGLIPNISKVFAPAEAPADAKRGVDKAAAVKLPLPRELLANRPKPVERAALTPAELYKAVEKSVFVVYAARTLADARALNVSLGSAVAISENLLLTNCHVVQDRPLIKLVHDHTVDEASLVASEPAADRCVLKTATLTLAPVPGVASFDSLSVGQHVFAIGTPRALERTMSDGLISGLRHLRGSNLVQTSAAVSPGSSGGGLFDERGNLVGITTLGSKPGSQNLNFAIAAADFWP